MSNIIFTLISVLFLFATLAGAAPKIDISGIIYDSVEPAALVNGKLVKEGDSIAEAKVLKINPNSIEFATKDEKFTVTIEEKPGLKNNILPAKSDKTPLAKAVAAETGVKTKEKILALVFLGVIGAIFFLFKKKPAHPSSESNTSAADSIPKDPH